MSAVTHGVFTRKQAGTIFAAHKNGHIFMTKQQIADMYSIVNYSWKNMTPAKREFGKRLRNALDYIGVCEYDLAQDCINGKQTEDSLECAVKFADVDRFVTWDVEPEYISIEPTFDGYRIVC